MKTTATTLVLLLCVLHASATSFNGAVQGATPSMVFTLRDPSDQTFSFKTTTIADTRAPTASASGSGSGEAATVSLSQTSPPAPGGSCRWGGVVVRHNAAKYFAGRAHRRGSIFGECVDGVLTCYEDSGLADTETTQHRRIACERRAVDERQRDLDLEDRAASNITITTGAASRV